MGNNFLILHIMPTYLDIFDQTVLTCCDHFIDSPIITSRNWDSDFLSIGISDK